MSEIPSQPPAETFRVAVTQYLLPHGTPSKMDTRLPISAMPDYADMTHAGCRFEAEVLRTGEVSVTIYDIEEEMDVDMEIVQNGPAVQFALVKMLGRQWWKKPNREKEGKVS